MFAPQFTRTFLAVAAALTMAACSDNPTAPQMEGAPAEASFGWRTPSAAPTPPPTPLFGLRTP